MNEIPSQYSKLNPDLILNAIESVGYVCNGGLHALNSYENRVYQMGIEDGPPLIAKFYRPERWSDAAILEEHQFAAELVEHEIPVIAPLANQDNKTLHEYEGFRFGLFARQGGRTIELDNLEHLEWMGRFIGRLHAVGSCRPFEHRIQINVQNYGYQPYQFLQENNFLPAELKNEYNTVIEAILQICQTQFDNIPRLNTLRLHGDCHAGNVLWNDTGPRIVDLDDCLMGPAIQDIWMLISGEHASDKQLQLHTVLDGYQEFHDFDYREIRLIEVLRTLRMIHYSGWLAKRWNDPAFPLAFPWFNTLNYWKEQLHHLKDQLEILEQAAIEF